MKKVDRTYRLLRDTMENAFHVECHHVSTTEEFSSEKIDHGLREMMWKDYHTNTSTEAWANEFLSQNSLLSIRSNLGFYNILITVIDAGPQIFLIGPFRAEAANALYFERIIQESGVPQERIIEVQSIFRTLPVASLTRLIATAKRIIEEFYPDFKHVESIEKKFVGEKHIPNLNNENSQYLASYWEQYQAFLMSYLNSLKKGDLSRSRADLKNFLNYCKFDTADSPEHLRRIAILLNDYSALTLFSTNIHPYRIFQLQNQVMQLIIRTNENNTIANIINDICHKYTLLVKNHNYDGYSKIVRDIINYIDLHLDEEMNLELFAEKYNRNASTLSTQFHRETGITLVTYIKQARVHRAIMLFNTTEKSISEISLLVGYEDFAYFSRVFKQITGISPRAYKTTTS